MTVFSCFLQNDFRPDPLPELPNVKKLTLTVGAHKDDYLRGFASIANACPNLETFTIEVYIQLTSFI